MSYINALKSYEDMFPSIRNAFNFYDSTLTSTNAEKFASSDARSEVNENEWKVELDVPGFTQEQISVEITKKDYFDIIKIVAKSKTRSANFSYQLKVNVFDYEQYKMKLDLGVLTIQIPKLKEQNSEKKIELKF